MFKVCVYEKYTSTDFIDCFTNYFFNDFKKAQSFYLLKCRIAAHCTFPNISIISLLSDGYPEITFASQTFFGSEEDEDGD